MIALLVDAGIPDARVKRDKARDGEGRFGFRVKAGGGNRSVDMPGVPLGDVRIEPGGTPRGKPRLYVDGSSWIWDIAARILRESVAA